jgi:transaldolase/glucose-6-phosphate isomerase
MTGQLAAAGSPLPGDLQAPAGAALERALAEDWVDRIWRKDPTLWSDDPETGERIVERLGWLHAPEAFLDHAEELVAFADAVRDQGFTAAVLCGMGGSSLAPEVLSLVYGVAPGALPLRVLDSTDPGAVADVLASYDPHRTLYVVSSKSGTTTETLSFLAAFWNQLAHEHGRGTWPAEHFAAITDPGRSLDAIPHSDSFRSIFLNPPDVGGRYSALTYVGLVPGALLGVDLDALLGSAVGMAQACREDSVANPGLALGVTLGVLARGGRDKCTFLADPAIAPFGAWAEQLIAESTGKHGVGIVPVDREPTGAADRYGRDRVFVRLLHGSDSAWRGESDVLAAELRALDHPVVDVEVSPDGGLGAEFFRWEFATAVAGAVIGINPFDEPNVTESKDNTRRVLGAFRETGALPGMPALAAEGPITLVGDAALRLSAGPGTLAGELRRHVDRMRPTGYASIQAYIAPSAARDEALAGLRRLLRNRTGRATTAGYGPRFLHSTGQLHKGGAPIGWFLQLVAGHPADVDIPGAGHSFGTLIDAQALGDFQALESHELPVLRVHLSSDPDAGLAALTAALGAVL